MTQSVIARQRAESDARTNGCYLNPDKDFLDDLFQGIVKNEERYGYPLCPCRLATGKLDFDADVICPCIYRDIDVLEYGCCYCALYVRKDVYEGKTTIGPISERRPRELQIRAYGTAGQTAKPSPVSIGTLSEKPREMASENLAQPTEVNRKAWYCRQCGYVSYREIPPYICPICKAKQEMFARLEIGADFRG